MNRHRPSNMYARFNDIFEEPDELPTAVFSSDGKIEFVNIDDTIKKEKDNPKPELPPDREVIEKKTKTKIGPTRTIRISRKALIFSIFAIAIFILFIFTFASFIMVLQNGGKINPTPTQPNITSLVDSRLDLLLPKWLNRTITKLQSQFQISPVFLREKIEESFMNLTEKKLAIIRGLCKVKYEDKCYWAIKAKGIQYYAAAELCHGHGAEAANVYGENHFQMIVKYLRKFMAPSTTVWLGMTRNSRNGTNHYRNLTISNYTMDWYPGYPSNRPSYTRLGVHFEKDPNATNQGFFNDYPTSNRHGVLCEI